MSASRAVRVSAGLAVAFLSLMAAQGLASAVQVGTGVVFYAKAGMEYRFVGAQHYGSIHLGTSHLKLDALDLRFQFPAGTFWANVTGANLVNQVSGTITVVEWLGTANATATSWFNVSGLTPGTAYTFTVDTADQGTFTADLSGSIFISWANAAMDQHEFAIHTPYAGVSQTDWTLILLIIFFIILLVLGFVASWFHILCGIEGFLLAYDIWLVTQNDGLTILVAGFALLMLVLGIFRRMEL